MSKLDDLDLQLREKTKTAIGLSRAKWKDRQGWALRQPSWSVTFLGTGGNPEAEISQHPRTAGFLVDFGELFMYVDPGPSALPAALEAGVDLGALDAIYVSHGHVDHYAGAESVIEGMCWAMSTRRGLLLAPKKILTEEKLISDFHQGATERYGYLGGPDVVYLKDGQTLEIKGAKLTPVTAYHGSENYGFILEANGLRLGYTGDTNYIRAYRNPEGIEEIRRFGPIMDLEEIVEVREDIKAAFSQVDVLIANVTSHNAWAHRHITTLGLAHLLKGTAIKCCWMSHFNYCCVEPEDIRFQMAEYVEGRSGVRVRVAEDGSCLDLRPYLPAPASE